MTIGKRITKFRKEHKLSQEKLSEKLSITRQTLSNYENDITIPDIEMANNIAKTLNVSLDELLGNDLSFIESKLNNNEKLTRRNSKLLRILLVTIYFIVLISLIYIMIYYLNKRDFTYEYQTDITCYIKNPEYTEYLRIVLDEGNGGCLEEDNLCSKDNARVCDVLCDESKKFYYYLFNLYVKDEYKNGEEKEGEIGPMLAGYSLKDAVESMATAKELLIKQGYTCK